MSQNRKCVLQWWHAYVIETYTNNCTQLICVQVSLLHGHAKSIMRAVSRVQRNPKLRIISGSVLHCFRPRWCRVKSMQKVYTLSKRVVHGNKVKPDKWLTINLMHMTSRNMKYTLYRGNLVALNLHQQNADGRFVYQLDMRESLLLVVCAIVKSMHTVCFIACPGA